MASEPSPSSPSDPTLTAPSSSWDPAMEMETSTPSPSPASQSQPLASSFSRLFTVPLARLETYAETLAERAAHAREENNLHEEEENNAAAENNVLLAEGHTSSSSSAAAAHVQKDTAAEQAAFCSPAYLWKLWWRVDAVLADLFGLNKSKYQPYVDEAHRQHVRHQRKIQEENDAADAQVNDAETGQTAAASEPTTTLTDR